MNTQLWDTVIIGGGAAGLSAAQTLGRSLRRTLVIDSGTPRNRFAGHMHNVLGHDGTPPAELYSAGRAELAKYNVSVIDSTVTHITDHGATLQLTIADGAPINTRSLLLATGITDELPAIPGLAETWGNTSLHCPYCHGWEVRGQRIGIFATSPLAAHHAKLLRQWTEQLTVFTHGLRDEHGNLDEQLLHTLRSRGIQLVDAPVTELLHTNGALHGVRTSDGQVHQIDAVFTAGTPRANDAIIAPFDLERTPSQVGLFLSVDHTQRTSHQRIWAAGNVVSPMATVPLAMAAGSMAGAAINMALVEEDFAAAEAGMTTVGNASDHATHND